MKAESLNVTMAYFIVSYVIEAVFQWLSSALLKHEILQILPAKFDTFELLIQKSRFHTTAVFQTINCDYKKQITLNWILKC